jgi:hypothetical protein
LGLFSLSTDGPELMAHCGKLLDAAGVAPDAPASAVRSA